MFVRYNICYVTQGGRVLLVNRERPSWMGCWNGIGGKLEPGEPPREAMIRELEEETGLSPISYRLHFKGAVTWTVDDMRFGGMYLYRADLADDIRFETPVKYEEGILDWKTVEWTLHPDNQGTARNLSAYLPYVLDDEGIYDHHGVFAEGRMLRMNHYPIAPLTEDAAEIERYVMQSHGTAGQLRVEERASDVRGLLALCMMPDDARILDETTRYEEDTDRIVWGYTLLGVTAGMLGVKFQSAHEAVLLHAAVQQSYQGAGIGRRMIRTFLEHFPDVRRLEAETDRDAVGFYRALGFEIESLGEKYQGVERFRCIWIKMEEGAKCEESISHMH